MLNLNLNLTVPLDNPEKTKVEGIYSIANNNYSNTNTAFTSQTAINNNSISGYTTGDLKTRVLQLEDSMRALQAENAQLRQQLQNMGNQ